MGRHAGLSGKGTPGRDLESAADRQAGTTGGINYPGTDVNREGGAPAEAGVPVDAGSPVGTGSPDYTMGSPLLDSSWLDSLAEDLDFPCVREDVLAAVAHRDQDHPDSGIDIIDLVSGLPQDRFMNPAELRLAMRQELEQRGSAQG